jgi:flagellar hook-associated protein 2
MAGIQVSGLLSNSAFDWKSVVDQLIAIDTIPVTNLQKEQSNNNDQSAALGDINTALQSLQDSVQAIRAGNPFQNRTILSDNANSSWKASSSANATVGSYKFNVTQLATTASMLGAADIGQSISSSADVSSVTLSTMNTATAVTAGFFTVNGQQITVSTADSLQSVFDQIASKTGNAVTASYDPTADAVTLTDSSGAISLGAGNDTSNFLQVMKLANNGTGSLSSFASLGTLKLTSPVASGALKTAVTAVDGSGNGNFFVNGVEIDYNINTDSLSTIMGRINTSSAGVTATYDSVNDQMTLTNKSTGDIGMSISESAGGLLGALGLTGASLTAGKNAEYYLNGSAAKLTSMSNSLSSASHGINGLTLTVNSLGTETLTVSADTASMQQSLQSFLDNFNAVQDLIDKDTAITVSGGTVTTSILSSNHEVDSWAKQLHSLAFNSISGLTGTVTHLDDLGIDFDGTTGHLTIKDSGKLTDKLANHSDDVQAYFLNGSTSLIPSMYSMLTNLKSADSSQQESLTSANNAINDQIATLQRQIDQERETLTNSFIQMLDAQSQAQSQTSTLTNAFFNNNGCWVARAVYGENNVRWVLFRHWLLFRAPRWFRALYLRHGEAFARWLGDKAWLKSAIRWWMDARIAGLGVV